MKEKEGIRFYPPYPLNNLKSFLPNLLVSQQWLNLRVIGSSNLIWLMLFGPLYDTTTKENDFKIQEFEYMHAIKKMNKLTV